MRFTAPRRPSARHAIVVVIWTMMAMPPILLAQEAVPAYCPDLKRVSELATTTERFASISATPREGNFVNTSLILTGWEDCSLYGPRTNTCDSLSVESVEEAGQAQQRIFREVQACLADSWAEAKNRSSVGFIVLQHMRQPVSMTLSTDQTDRGRYVVRLILFARSN
jgi:hypothetical protein